MALVYKIQEFLKKKFNELNLKRKDFSRNSGIPYPTVVDITKGVKLNPSISNILKIANYFRCPTDEVIGRDQYITLHSSKGFEFNKITSDVVIDNLKQFLKNKVKNHNINLHNLSIDIGFSYNALNSFVNGNRGQKTLNSQIVVALANYFQVSLDEMIGRVKPTTAVNSSEKNSDKDIDLNNLYVLVDI